MHLLHIVFMRVVGLARRGSGVVSLAVLCTGADPFHQTGLEYMWMTT